MSVNLRVIGGMVGRNLTEFKIEKMTEVYGVDEDGRKTKTVGFFKKQDIAVAFAGTQKGSFSHKTNDAFVLTDGAIGFVIETIEPVTLFNDEEEALKIRKEALAKLSAQERRILGFEE